MTPPQIPVAAFVALLIDGVFAPAAPPAQLLDGRVLAPAAFVARIADRVALGEDGTMRAERGQHKCSARTQTVGEAAFVAVAPLARCLGANVAWDARTRSLGLAFAADTALDTPAPYDPAAPRVRATTIFTPEPPPPTPRVIATGAPRPRRTAIPAVPSLPLATPTGRRP